MSTATNAIELHNVSKTFDGRRGLVAAVQGVSLQVSPGEVVAVMGPSGSGKSTLLHLTAGLIRPTSGEVTVCGEKLSDRDQSELAVIRQRHIGFVFQSFNLIPVLNAEENVALPARLAGRSRSTAIGLAANTMDATGVTHLRRERVADLSGGEQQRVAIARALILQPDLLLADEPTGNLDTDTGRAVMDLFAKLNQAGQTIVLVTHDVRVARLANRIVTIRDGAVEQETRLTPDEAPSLDVLNRLLS